MELGVHLPLADLGQGLPSGRDLRSYAALAAELGFTAVAANDHLVWRTPWLDGPTALAAVCGSTGRMRLVTSVALPVIRHPVVLAKGLAALATLADGPVVAGLGPGSSREDHRLVGIPFDQRWARFDEALRSVRAVLAGESVPDGSFYPGGGAVLSPPAGSVSVWSASWGSSARLRAVARDADGWMASAFHMQPGRFRSARAELDTHLLAVGRDPATFGDLVATTWLYVTDDRLVARWLVEEILAPLLGQDPESLAAHLPIGPSEHCARVLSDYATAGAGTVLLWPLSDPLRQLELVAEQVRPLVLG
ncbi:LLM class flavin-dependent oxidoreductase [Actinomycetospora sp.]|jgi:alkanesulfonate monooxygenase SsuD/methylene tetrahydromethanopterin reductase-like flavin-dependent oxidoreductase (luciferase family)|uniref:LLM class flavin-dependent oxidoreductase n=1 Tax=Actinomycetospora sp. TaxID=1872135 RepID=UPI002F41FECF